MIALVNPWLFILAMLQQHGSVVFLMLSSNLPSKINFAVLSTNTLVLPEPDPAKTAYLPSKAFILIIELIRKNKSKTL